MSATMSSSSSDDDLLFLENVQTKIKRTRVKVHPINSKRHNLGEYQHLFIDLREDEARFYQYTRMKQYTITIFLIFLFLLSSMIIYCV